MELSRKKKVAILGATGYIGRSLVGTSGTYNFEVIPFSRDVAKAKKTFSSYGMDVSNISSYDTFLDKNFDLIVNATGIGSPRDMMANPTKVFSVTEAMDYLLFSYLEKCPETRVFNISSGSVYGLSAQQPIEDGTLVKFDFDQFNPGIFYSLAKLYSEAKHRSRPDYHIVDLRVFAFISRWLDREESFFIAEVVNSILKKEVLSTMPVDMVRDYCTADDIWKLIIFLSNHPAQNSAFDMQSKLPVSKFELLDNLSLKFGLKYKVSDELKDQSPTGSKNAYYSKSDKLFNLNYSPEKSSLENIESEINFFLNSRK